MKELFKFIDILARITYKPGFKMTLEIHDWNSGCVELKISHKTISVSKSEPALIYHTEKIVINELSQMTEKEFIALVYNAVTHLERHEQDEWFKVDGRPLVEPHPEA